MINTQHPRQRTEEVISPYSEISERPRGSRLEPPVHGPSVPRRADDRIRKDLALDSPT
jgi:hypothetical protein